MKNRRGFLTALTAVATTGAAAAMAASSKAQTPAPAASATPTAGPQAAAVTKPPSAAALAFAQTYRSFDPKLSDAELVTIAHGIDDNRTTGAALNLKRKPLRNSDEPVARFAAAESVSA